MMRRIDDIARDCLSWLNGDGSVVVSPAQQRRNQAWIAKIRHQISAACITEQADAQYQAQHGKEVKK